MKVLTKRAKDITKLLLPYKPTEILEGLANHKIKDPELNIEQVHFFPIGGIKQTADYIKEINQ
jgi:methylenetetrahydrofolate reductase (NADPH)